MSAYLGSFVCLFLIRIYAAFAPIQRLLFLPLFDFSRLLRTDWSVCASIFPLK